MMAGDNSSCYMCDAVATSQIHVPSPCLLPPEYRDQNGMDYQTSLITAPACDRHNATPGDDSALLAALTATASVDASSQQPEDLLEKYARALYFHECGRKITGKPVIKTGFLDRLGEDATRKNAGIAEIIKYFSHHEQKGSHPDLFNYCFMQDNRSATFLMRFHSDQIAVVFFIKQ